MKRRVAIDRSDDDRRKVPLAILLSILLHLLLILGVAAVIAFRPPPPPPAPAETPVELTIVEPPPEPPKKQQTVYIETNEDQRSAKPPEKAAFESDKDTQAASEKPAAGNEPLPTMDGRESQGIEFQNREYTAGPQARPATPPAPPPQPAQVAAQPAEAKPVSTPAPTPQQMPTPRQTTQLTLLEPPVNQEKPKPTPEQKPEEQQKQADQRPPQPQTPPAPPSVPGYQPQTRITKLRGDISNRGRNSVAANATPLGRYKKALSDAIGSRWYYYVREQMGLLNTGTLSVSFIVRDDGKVEKVRVISNTSNESFAACSVRAIIEAEIPPIPQELASMLQGNRIEIEYSFTIFSN